MSILKSRFCACKIKFSYKKKLFWQMKFTVNNSTS